MDNKITIFRISSKELQKWMHQNKAEYTDCYEEGNLLDNFVMECKNGFAAFYERYVNEWSSIYEVHFQRDEAKDIFSEWYNFEEIYAKL